MTEKILVKITKKDGDILDLYNVKYDDESKLEIFLFNKLLVKSGLAINILVVICLILFSIAVKTSFFAGMAFTYAIALLLLMGYNFTKYGERTSWYGIEKADKRVYRVGQLMDYKAEVLSKTFKRRSS